MMAKATVLEVFPIEGQSQQLGTQPFLSEESQYIIAVVSSRLVKNRSQVKGLVSEATTRLPTRNQDSPSLTVPTTARAEIPFCLPRAPKLEDIHAN